MGDPHAPKNFQGSAIPTAGRGWNSQPVDRKLRAKYETLDELKEASQFAVIPWITVLEASRWVLPPPTHSKVEGRRCTGYVAGCAVVVF